jgi:hypothetical protein
MDTRLDEIGLGVLKCHMVVYNVVPEYLLQKINDVAATTVRYILR